jgi:hypothetical protein
MGHKRKKAASAKGKANGARDAKNGSARSGLTCPECGQSFDRPASLGAHRHRAHGVAGSSSTSRRRKAATEAGTATSAAAVGANGRNGAVHGIDRDALLAVLFPDGIPPREETIRSVNRWLDEAERLANI